MKKEKFSAGNTHCLIHCPETTDVVICRNAGISLVHTSTSGATDKCMVMV
jgi:hypothetical protein